MRFLAIASACRKHSGNLPITNGLVQRGRTRYEGHIITTKRDYIVPEGRWQPTDLVQDSVKMTARGDAVWKRSQTGEEGRPTCENKPNAWLETFVETNPKWQASSSGNEPKL
jgi:hypothetical protein